MAVNMKSVIAVGVFLGMFFHSPHRPANPGQNLSFCELVKNPAAFSGKQIRLRAIYRYAFESQRLEPPTCCPAPGANIWVEISTNLEGKALRLFRNFPKGHGLVLATFVGRFDTGDSY